MASVQPWTWICGIGIWFSSHGIVPSKPFKLINPERIPSVVNWPNKTLPFASGTHKGSVPTLNIEASEFGEPPKVHEEPERLEPKPTSPTVLGPEV